MAATPQNEAGRITEPPVCVPNASGIIPAATAAAEPDDDPPGVCCGLRGLRVAVGSTEANAVVVVLPTLLAPACFRAATTAPAARTVSARQTKAPTVFSCAPIASSDWVMAASAERSPESIRR